MTFHLLRPAVVTQEETELPKGVQEKLTDIGVPPKLLIMKKKGLSPYKTFEDSMKEYQNHSAYRIETRAGREYLIVTKAN